MDRTTSPNRLLDSSSVSVTVQVKMISGWNQTSAADQVTLLSGSAACVTSSWRMLTFRRPMDRYGGLGSARHDVQDELVKATAETS